MRELERAIILLLLSDDGKSRWSGMRLAAELGADARVLRDALAALARAGVVCLEGTEVSLTPAVRRLDELELIGI